MRLLLIIVLSFITIFGNEIPNINNYIKKHCIEKNNIFKIDLNQDNIDDYVMFYYENINLYKFVAFISNENKFDIIELDINSSGFGIELNSNILNLNKNQFIVWFAEKDNVEAKIILKYNKYTHLFNGSFGYYKYSQYDAYGKSFMKQTYLYYPNFILGEKDISDLMDNVPFYIEENVKWIPTLNKDNIIKLIELNYFSKENITIYNDTAYYLQQANANDEAIFLLEKIIEKYPNRTVAYLNLADAYIGINDKEKSKENYKKYIELMKQDNKEEKIPKRVLEFLKN